MGSCFIMPEQLADDSVAEATNHDPDRLGRMRILLGIPEISDRLLYNSQGQFMGRFGIVAQGGAVGAKTSAPEVGGVPGPAGDWAVLRLVSKASGPSAIQRFGAAPGLTLASVMSPDMTSGVSGDGTHPSVSGGFSGGPIFDADGRVHAVSSAAGIEEDGVPVNGLVSVMDLHEWGGDMAAARKTGVTLMQHTRLYANPLGNPLLLASLGKAGIGVTTSYQAPLYSGHERMTAAGMPTGVCSASPTVQGPIGPRKQDARPALKVAPLPFEVGKLRGGTVVTYDAAGLAASVSLKNGDVVRFERGRRISTERHCPARQTVTGQDNLPVTQAKENGGNCRPG